MKFKLVLMCAVVAISLSFLACSPAPKQAAIDISCDNFRQRNTIAEETEVTAGDSFTVTLCSNPTTGFQWAEAQISDQAVIAQVDHKFEAPEYPSDRPPPPGTAGQEVWTFTALKEGESTISMEYNQPWEGGLKGEWTFVLAVVVK